MLQSYKVQLMLQFPQSDKATKLTTSYEPHSESQDPRWATKLMMTRYRTTRSMRLRRSSPGDHNDYIYVDQINEITVTKSTRPDSSTKQDPQWPNLSDNGSHTLGQFQGQLQATRPLQTPRLRSRCEVPVSTTYLMRYGEIVEDSLWARYDVVVETSGLETVPRGLKYEVSKLRNDM